MNQAQSVTTISPETLEPMPARADIIAFPRGIPGFEGARGFVLMAPDVDTGVRYLRSVDGTPASFLVMDPRVVLPGYRCELNEGDRERLHATAGDPSLVWLALVTIETDGTIVANLRAPVVINPQQMVGAQVI